MGGSRSQPKQEKSEPQPPIIDPMIAFLAAQKQQQAKADAAKAELEKKKQIETQNEQARQSGMQAQQQGETAARSALSGMNVGQQAQDQATMAAQQKTSAPIGGATPSPVADAGQYRQASLGTMGGQQGATAMAANAGVGGGQQRNNQFQVPATTGLTFGGA
jgi:hypothetical protein